MSPGPPLTARAISFTPRIPVRVSALAQSHFRKHRNTETPPSMHLFRIGDELNVVESVLGQLLLIARGELHEPTPAAPTCPEDTALLPSPQIPDRSHRHPLRDGIACTLALVHHHRLLR